MRILALLVAFAAAASAANAQDNRPNIVLIFPDNLGWGEVGAYGAVRGVPTSTTTSGSSCKHSSG